MTKLHEGHQARSPYEPTEQVAKPEKKPNRAVGGRPLKGKAEAEAEAPPKKKAAKKKAAK